MVTPIFSSHYGQDALLTFEEPGKAKAGAPVSVFDLSKEAGLTEVVVADSRIDGFLAAYRTATKMGVKLCYGIKLVVAADHTCKDPESRRSESKIIVFARNTEGYYQLTRLYSRAWTQGLFTFRQSSYGRIDWALLNEYWTENLLLALPFFSSFLQRNTLTMNVITPSLPTKPWVFREVGSGLPFEPLIAQAVDRYAKVEGCEVVETKSIYYKDRASFKAYQIYRCLHAKSTYEEPELEHMVSDNFCFEAYKELC